MSDIKICVNCGCEFEGPGNNPEPVYESGVCCDDCNAQIIIPERIRQIFWGKNKKFEDRR